MSRVYISLRNSTLFLIGRRAPVRRSRVGQKLSELTTSRVVVLVLSMLFILPIYNIGGGIYGNPPLLGVEGLVVRPFSALSIL